MLTLYRMAFAPARKSCRIGLLFTHNGDFGAISVTERSCAAPISKVKSHILDRCSYYTGAVALPVKCVYSLRFTFTANANRQIQGDNFLYLEISRNNS